MIYNIRKIVKAIIVISLIIFFAFIANSMWVIFLKDYIPNTKTYFKNYDQFKEKENGAFYLKELPSSARDIQYYYYTGYFDSKSGVSFIVDDEKEYQDVKQFYILKFSDYEVRLNVIENIQFLFNQPLTNDFIYQKKIELLEELIVYDIDDYSILAYMETKKKQEGRDHTGGVICNDTTHEIIIFECQDAHN